MKDLKDILAHPYNQKDWTDFLTQLFHEKDSSSNEGILSSPQRIPMSHDKVKEAYELGSYLTSDERLIGIYQVNISEDMLLYRNKVGLRKLMAKIYKYNVDGVLVAFVQEKKWRLSFISEFVKGINPEGKMIEQTTDEKRFTYLLGEGEKTKTATDRLKNLVGKPLALQDFFEVFSVEMLSKDFFREYKEIYEEFVAEIFKEEHNQALFKGNDKAVRDFVKRMMGRIVFLYFIQKKGWLAVPKGKNWGEGNHNYLYHLYLETPKKDWPYFYEKRLVPLFFDTLTNKDSESEDNPLRFPYLNGGLFDKSQDENFDTIALPYQTFSRLFDTFDKYNFTVYEDSPNEHTVAVDPEMLGHIFENLLEDNKDKGAFYTPKEIVHYMCKESLKTFLYSKLPQNAIDERPKKTIAKIVEHQPLEIEETLYLRQEGKNLASHLEQVKICDPAIGSGAFPMGLLQEIYYLKVTLQQLGIIPEQNDAQIKKHIIEQNIYGVDIDSGAVDIARLRFWLSLVVDEPKPQPLPNLDFKIMQGNSLLESYQEVDLSHIGKEEEIIAHKDSIDFGDNFKTSKQIFLFTDTHKEHIQQLIKDYFTSTEDKILKRKQINDLIEEKIRAKIYKEKLEIRGNIDYFFDKYNLTSEEDLEDKLQKGILTSKGREYKAYIANQRRLSELNTIENELISFQTKIERPYFLWHTYFKDVFDKGGFDIVIGNPPYVNVEKIDLTIKSNIDRFRTAYKKYDLYVLFYEKALQLLKKGGVLSFITSNKFLSQEYGLILRQELLKNTIETIVNFNYDIFDNATVRTCILILSKQEPKYKHSIKLIDINSKKDTEKFINRKYDTISQNVFKTTEYNNFRINLTEEKMSILDKIDEKSIKLEEICSVNYGLRPSSEILGLKKESFISKDKKDGYKTYFEGKDMGYWKVLNYSFLDYQPKVMYNPMFKELFDNPKLVGLRTLSDIGKLRFIYDNKGYYCNDSVVILTLWYLFKNVNNNTIKRNISNKKIELSKEFEYKYLQGILNSKLIKFYVNELFYDGTHFYPNQMKALPIKKANKNIQQLFVILVNMIHHLQPNISENIFTHTSNLDVASHFQNILDMMVYELYFEIHTKVVGVDVLQFIKPMIDEIQKLSINEQIEIFYKWYQQSENKVRQRVLLLDTRSENLLAIINKII